MDGTIELRVGHCEELEDDLEKRLCEEHDRLDNHSDSINRLLQWGLDGNGRSAETRLTVVEDAVKPIPEMQETLRVVKLVADAKLTSIEDAVSNAITARDKTMIAKVRAFAPYVVGAMGLAVALLDRFWPKW